jgi:pyruvate/2-oxoglutarate/acetoin dehydrogenase E1 component
VSEHALDGGRLKSMLTQMLRIREFEEKTGRLVVIDQSTRHGPAAAVIAAEAASDGFASLTAPIRLVTALDATIPYSEPMEVNLLPDEGTIVGAVQELLGSTAVSA